MLPMTVGFLVAGPVSGYVSDRLGARAFATGGLLLTAATFVGLIALPANFSYPLFAVLLALNGIGMGLMAAPNTAAIMNAVPARERGAASGIRATGMNAGMVLSMGAFFTLMAIGLAARLPATMASGLTGAGVNPSLAATVAHQPPVGLLFAAFLGYNPMATLVPGQSASVAAHIGNRTFFPNLISGPFHDGLTVAFLASILMLLIAAGASLMRGGRYVHSDTDDDRDDAADPAHHDSVVAAMGHEGGALASVLDADHGLEPAGS
jgi:MFS family permease